MKEISIIGATITGNRGAEAMLTTVICMLKENLQDIRISVYSYYPATDKSLNIASGVCIYPATPLYLVCVLFPLSLVLGLLHRIGWGRFSRLFPKSIRRLYQSRVLIDLAGVCFMDGREKFVPFNVLSILPALVLNIPVIKLSQAMGPIEGVLVRIPAALVLPRCRKIFARGAQTKEYLERLPRLRHRIDLASDVAFCHRPGYAISAEHDDYIKKLNSRLQEMTRSGRPVIGICPSSVIMSNANREGWDYIAFLYQIIIRLINENYAIFLFPNATRKTASRKLRNNDLPVIEDVIRYLTAFNEYSEKICFVTEDINTDAIKRLMNHCRITVVSRFHAMVASLALEKPTVVMGWGHKYLEVMNMFGLDGYVLDYRKNSPGILTQKIFTALADEVKIKSQIKVALPRVQDLSMKQFHYLYELLG